MATTRTFQAMLNEYLPNSLLQEELIKRDWFLTNVEKDNNWKGGKIIVPFQGASASSIKFGGLTASNDISEFSFVRGSIDNYREVWGSLIFNHTDIMQHDGKVKESSFLKILPDQVDSFINYMKMAVSLGLLTGPAMATVTDATNAATGIMVVDKIDRFELGQHLLLDDGNSNAIDVYVIAINTNTSAVTVSATRGGAALDVSAYTVAQSAKFYYDGMFSNVANPVDYYFTSLRAALLSAANGGDATLHGQTKLSYPYLQAVNVSGAAISAANILDKIFDAYNEIRKKAKAGRANKCVMSYKHLGSIMKLIEAQKGPFKVTPTSSKASLYGWDEVEITSVSGSFTIVALQEMDDDIILFLDMSALTFRSNGFFKKRVAPDGKEFYEVRSSTGYQYIVDVCLFGELEVRKPTSCGIIHSIPNY